MMALRQTLLPVPVLPAINRCGILAKSTTMGVPETSFPRKTGMFIFALWVSDSSITSRKRTTCRVSLGTSIPTVFFPGIGATIRTLGTRNAMARSSESPVILLRRKPASSLISYCEITGPISICSTAILKPKSRNVRLKISDLLRHSWRCSS